MNELQNPSRAEWVQSLRLWCLILGFALAVSGVLYFFAYNWAELSKHQKFGLLEALLTGLFLGTLSRGVETKVGQVLLISASVLVGVLLAVIGQVYQSGADSYLLFFAWSILILPWCLAGRSNTLWVLQFILANTALALWWDQAVGQELYFFPILLAFNFVLATAWEMRRTYSDWMKAALTEALLFTGIAPIALSSSAFIIDTDDELAIHLPCLLIACGLIWHFRKKSMPGRVLLAGSGLSLGTALSIRLFMDTELLGALLVGISIMAQLALIVRWLKAFQDTLPSEVMTGDSEFESPPEKDGFPWYVHLLIGTGAWVASLFLIIFFLIFASQAEVMILIYGLALYLISLRFKILELGEFARQACLASHLAGIILVTFGVAELSSYETALPAIVGMALFLVSGLKFEDPFGGFLFGFGFSLTGCWASFLVLDPFLSYQYDELGPIIWIGLSCVLLSVLSWQQLKLMKRFTNPSWLSMLRGFTASTLILSTTPLVDRLRPETTTTLYAVTLVALLLLSWRSDHPPRAILGLAIFSFLTQSVPTISVAILVYLVGFRARQKFVCAMAIAALVCSGSYFYYDLSMTLMVKSVTLISSGVSLLGLRMVLGRSEEESEHDTL